MNAYRFNLRPTSFLSGLILALPTWTPEIFRVGLMVAVFLGALKVSLNVRQLVHQDHGIDLISASVPVTQSEFTAPATPLVLAPSSPRIDTASVAQASPVTAVFPMPLTSFPVSSIPGGIEVTLPAAGFFVSGTAELNSSKKAELQALIQQLVALGYQHGFEVQISTYTDNSPVTTHRKQFPTNWELSGARSFAVVKLFETAGFASSSLSGVGFGQGRPLVQNNSTRNRLKNRRLTIRLTQQ